MMRLPLTAASFDHVVSGLAVGHAPDIDAWLAEVSRVLVPGGTLLYSDFHEEAARAGLTRSFTDQERRRLPTVLASRGRTRPVVGCPHQGLWVEPDFLCQVNYLEWTRAGRLRGASFHGLLAAP